jgi:transcriptional regulator with XRE-family HTH domain
MQPADVGMHGAGVRRVPGLRRGELAALAGVSVEHYTRIEQGRGVRPSQQVLDAIAGALRLAPAERAHVADLARNASAATATGSSEVRASVLRLLEQLDDHPAFVLDRQMDVLAWNRLAAALLGDFARLPPSERNMARLVFLDPRTIALYPDWEPVARETVAFLRRQAAADPGAPRLEALVGELSAASEPFRRWWASQDVRDKAAGVKRFAHPAAGPMELDYESLDVAGAAGQALVVYSAQPGTPSAAALAQLRDPQ